ncbi:MAG: hypothetical protein JXR88_05530 [Clostridia bacterium]|nr:hypothetical protein [Clostridia bacterium]
MFKSRLIKILVLVIILLFFVFLEYHLKINHEETLLPVPKLLSDMKEGAMITSKDYEIVYMPETLFNESTLANTCNGYYLKQSLPKETLLLSTMIQKEDEQRLKATERLITVKCSIVESNAWLAEPMDYVDLILVLPDEIITLEDVMIVYRFSETLDQQESFSYYTLKVDEKQAYLYYKNLKNCTNYISIKQKS